MFTLSVVSAERMGSGDKSWPLYYKGRTIRKVIGVGKKQKKNSSKEKVKKKIFCKVNCTVELANCTRLKGTLAAILYGSFKFLVLMESSRFTRSVFSTIRKTDIFPFQG